VPVTSKETFQTSPSAMIFGHVTATSANQDEDEKERTASASASTKRPPLPLATVRQRLTGSNRTVTRGATNGTPRTPGGGTPGGGGGAKRTYQVSKFSASHRLTDIHQVSLA
jgi:hypothetical protein